MWITDQLKFGPYIDTNFYGKHMTNMYRHSSLHMYIVLLLDNCAIYSYINLNILTSHAYM